MPEPTAILTNNVIETRGLGKQYGAIHALQSLDLRVPRQSILGFLGPNGAGKSTAIKLLLGLARPTAGSARVFDLDIRKQSLEIRRRVGYLSQEPRYYDSLTARETLRFAVRFFYSGPKSALERRIQETIELVGLAEKADRPIRGFSTGERQRLGIAQAQVHEPELLVLDEPAASLDPMGRHDVLDIMQRLREHGATVFYSTHILDDVQRVSDAVAILNRGRLVAQGPLAELLKNKADVTYTVAVDGNAEPTVQRLSAQPWVSRVDVLSRNGTTRLKVHVTDPSSADAHLLETIAVGGSERVQEFTRDHLDLEQVFMNLVDGGTSDGASNR